MTFSFFEDEAYATPTSPRNRQEVCFYANDYNGWHSVYGNNDLSCVQKRDRSKLHYPIELLATLGGSYSYTITGIIPRWWYITISHCEGEGLDAPIGVAYYSMHFTNRTGFWSFEFSKDVQGIAEMSIFFLCLYWVLLGALAWIKRHAKSKGLQYTVVKYLFVSVLIDFVALLFNMAHYTKFASDGVGVPELEHAYFFFDFVSNLVLLYVVLSICKGWAISTNYLPDRRFTYMVIGVLFLLYIALFIWQQKILDPASVLYVYETPPGWAIVAVRSALTLWGLVCVVRTYRLEGEKRRQQFYIVWGVLAVLWLVSLPIIVGIATALETWLRRRVVFGLLNSATAAIYLILTYLFRPFRSNRYVSILNPNETRAFGNNNMQVFPSAGPIEFATI